MRVRVLFYDEYNRLVGFHDAPEETAYLQWETRDVPFTLYAPHVYDQGDTSWKPDPKASPSSPNQSRTLSAFRRRLLRLHRLLRR